MLSGHPQERGVSTRQRGSSEGRGLDMTLALAVARLHMQSGVGWWCLDTAVGRAAAVSSVFSVL